MNCLLCRRKSSITILRPATAVYLANREISDMGGGHAHGHDHGHHHGIKVPDYRQYKVENAPELVQLRTLLAQKGLSDPWIRNEVWRYDPKEFGTTAQRWRLAAFRGFKWGFAAFIATITIEKGLELVNPPANNHHGTSHH
ncbi:NADH dehydrogenase [ubiquinone] 1 beta subcomplex subunit 3 [Daphnia magna]|uniref:NADH dehydrogenase [ubiquinone] 1 beta subcomplex subunit 3 n=3 Tax=Daphnia magna TaxID=35525 RepID=A0A0P5NA34_9CRUS|nr:hypothetical protein OUZ56_018760 [Daphnia magna]KZS07404.1 NADH dehydrogenase [ubiquinone] 1 beta subcomplex subunit 3 [Daphnia magna]